MLTWKDIAQISVNETAKSSHDMFQIPQQRYTEWLNEHSTLDKEQFGDGEPVGPEYLEVHLKLAFKQADTAQEFLAIVFMIARHFGTNEGANVLVNDLQKNDPALCALVMQTIKNKKSLKNN